MSFSSPTARIEDGLFLPEGASLFTRLRVAVRALKVLEKRPDDGIAAPLFNASLDGDVFQRHCTELAKSEDGRELLTQRPSLQGRNIDLAALGRLPEGTLGNAFARYFSDNGISPFESPYEVRNEVDFLVKWYRETHDLHHVVTGYKTDSLGEMELQAFVAGNLGLRTSVLILLFAALLRPHGLPPIWKYARKLRAAYRRGRQSEKLVRIRYERFWESTVETVRQQLRIPPPTPA
ncbi:Coq4 family protein [Archangium violaceum]|uniref:Coq4 family protein n=1 Tax=Archangium violaceum TaxID=83451 RepID=UPI002B2D8847|nr:Coq4 family protein [Archangium gephyra]